MVYHRVQLDLTRPQIKKVMTGGTIQIHPHKVGHGPMFHLTTMQHSKLRRHVTQGKGCRIHMDHKQIRHHIKHGAGFFDFIKNIGRKIARPLLNLGKNALVNMIPIPGIRGLASGLGDRGIDFLGKKLGFGLHRMRRVGAHTLRRRRKMTGGSFRALGQRMSACGLRP